MDRELIKRAAEEAVLARKNAYAPYSKFLVGAILITKEGDFFRGVNVENSSYGATICAERTALFSAVANGHKEFEAIVIASVLDGEAVYPCGLCRQVLADFNPDMKVILVHGETAKIEKEVTLREIFPGRFNLKPE
jgi:cytidine deaminase